MKDCRFANSYWATPPLMRNYFFDVGTYWIYKNRLTGELDSQWVGRVKIDPIETSVTSCNMHAPDGMEMAIKSSFITDSLYYYTTYRDRDQEELYHYSSSTANFPVGIATNRVGFESCIIYLPQTSVDIFGTTFTDVVAFRIPDTCVAPTALRYPTDFFFKPGIGIVEKKSFTPAGMQEWLLIRYHINPLHF